jgi:UDP-GlcNAc:undecaprenyl-phosphate GlcNAc-1-phosphate transferase
MPWGERQLAQSELIILLPIIAWGILLSGVLLLVLGAKFHLRYGKEIITNAVLFSLVLLAFSSVRIIFIASSPFEPFINPEILSRVMLFILSFLIAYIISPRVISYMFENGIVTDPNIHKHPGMVLVKPSARGGGLIFALSFVGLSLLLVPITKPLAALLIAVTVAALLGFADDIQNTKVRTKLKFLENPMIRLFFQGLIALFVVLMGFRIDFINNPFDGIIFFDQFRMNLFGFTLLPLAIIVTTLWLVWMMNMLSWSNAIDGQYSGILGIASLCLVFLTMRPGLEPTIVPKEVIASLAILLAGASLGILPFNWHPSKIMWGFGAISAGLAFAALSIATQAKIGASVIVILVPFMDGLITIVRRIMQGKFPLKADKQHLHHLLMERGWGVKKIAITYWLSTALLGFISIVSADRDLPLLILSVIGGVGLLIGLVNLQARRNKLKPQQSE